MKAKIFTLAGALMLLFFCCASAKAPADTVRILAIGNSFSQDAVEQNLYELADAEGIPVIIGNAYIAGCSLERHVMNSRDDRPAYEYRKIENGMKTEKKQARLSEIISDEQWDYVSLQQASPYSGQYVTYAEWLPELYSYVKSLVPADAVFMLHQTWAYSQDSTRDGFRNYGNDQTAMYEAIVDANARAANLVGIGTVIPSGTAVQNARATVIGDNMCRDGFHLNLVWGRYTAACTWFEILFGDVRKNGYEPADMPEGYGKICREAAHKAVRHPGKVSRM